jgi:hypothetical protein
MYFAFTSELESFTLIFFLYSKSAILFQRFHQLKKSLPKSLMSIYWKKLIVKIYNLITIDKLATVNIFMLHMKRNLKKLSTLYPINRLGNLI